MHCLQILVVKHVGHGPAKRSLGAAAGDGEGACRRRGRERCCDLIFSAALSGRRTGHQHKLGSMDIASSSGFTNRHVFGISPLRSNIGAGSFQSTRNCSNLVRAKNVGRGSPSCHVFLCAGGPRRLQGPFMLLLCCSFQADLVLSLRSQLKHRRKGPQRHYLGGID